MTMEFDDLPFDQLYERACSAVGCTPSPKLVDAFKACDDPRKALASLIAGTGNATADDGDGALDEKALDEIWQRAEASSGAKISRWLHAIAQLSLRPGGEAYIDKARQKLHEALLDLEQRAIRRQADRKFQRDVATGAALDPVIQQKLMTPSKLLAPQASRDCLVRCIEHGGIQAARADGQSLLVVLGNTGAGKSAFINMLHGCTFGLTDQSKMAVAADSAVSELMRIGHSNKSETFAPQVEAATAAFGDGYAFADCPGFLDNRGFEINVANAVNVKQAVARAASVRVVVIINYYSLLADRGKGVKDLLTILSGLFGTGEEVIQHSRSVLLAISQAPVSHAETGAPLGLGDHREKLLDPSGLDDDARRLLGTLGENVGIFHLLGRGDATWLTRDAIIERIKRLAPITAPASLFQTAIDEADKESLRMLVAGLAEQVRQTMHAGDYHAAADLVNDLFELRLVDTGFVAAIVHDGVNALMDERFATLHALLAEQDGEGGEGGDAQGGEGGGSEGDGGAVGGAGEAMEKPPPVDPQERVNDARRELRELSAVLAAFAGIPEVRTRLEGLLAEATLQLEGAVKRVAEAAGRRSVDGPLRDVLRAVGENVVREVLWLPARASQVRAAQREERDGLDRAHTAALRALHDVAAGDELFDAENERYGILVQEGTMRAQAANETWRAHIEQAVAKLARRDEALLAADGPPFWTKLAFSRERLCRESPIDWARKRIDDDDCEVISALIRSLDLGHLKVLILSSNAFGDAGVTALADATAFGALPALERAFLDNNQIGDEGMVELAGAMADGRLAELKFLDLNKNQIGDAGMSALARAAAGGALSSLATLYLHQNRIGDAGAIALAGAIRSPSTLSKLEKLWVYKNVIDDRGIQALTDALALGALPSLQLANALQLEGNPAKNEVQQAALDVVKGREPVTQEPQPFHDVRDKSLAICS